MNKENSGHRPNQEKDISDANIYVEKASSDILLEINKNSGDEVLIVNVGNDVLRTPKGYPITHSNPRALRELAAELDYSDELDVGQISLYNLLCTQIDFIEKNPSILTRQELDLALLNDPVLRTCAGPEVVEQMKYFHVVEKYLKKHNMDYPNMPQVPMQDHVWLSKVGGEDNFNKIIDHIYTLLGVLNDQERTVFVTVTHVFDSPIMGAIMTAQNITPHEFAITYMTALCINTKVFSGGDRNEEREMLQSITRDAECMLRYLNQFMDKEVDQLIKNGENIQTEFKSTLRWNLHTDCRDVKMEHSVLKTIIAFLNCDGGVLFVGVDDNGELVGIEADHFPNEDKYLLHFTNLVNSRIGKQFCNNISWEIVPYRNGKLMQVECTPSPKPAFLKTGNKEEFFIRTGPASVELSGSEMLDYTKNHFEK